MAKRIGAVVFIFLCTSTAWLILGTTLVARTDNKNDTLKGQVEQLWGCPQRQAAPSVSYLERREVVTHALRGDQVVEETKTQSFSVPTTLGGSRVSVDLSLQHRRRGLLWYPTYTVVFSGTYRIVNQTNETHDFTFLFELPVAKAVYDDFRLTEGAEGLPVVDVKDGAIARTWPLAPGQEREVTISYKSQGMDRWSYALAGNDVGQVRNFGLEMTTDFSSIDFPLASHSPTSREATTHGWRLHWVYSNLLSGQTIGMTMPTRLNPGPWASQVSFAAPVSLFLFFFIVFLAATVKRVRIHAMNYFFLAAAFFSFHLLLAYLIDHISIHLAFVISSAVSVALVLSYMRLVVGATFALREVLLAQLVYLVLFSYTFFFVGYTGLSITIMCILSLFLVMQWTARVNWEEAFADGAAR